MTRPVLESLVVALILSPLDHGTATLAGPTSELLDRVLSAQNATARLTFDASRMSTPHAPLLRSLHWLSVRERISFFFL